MSGEDVQLSSGERIGRGVTLFFNSAAIAARIDAPVRRQQSLAAYHTRQVARRRVRPRRRSSRAGESPSGHGSQKLRAGILFARNPSTRSFLVGPQLQSLANDRDRPMSGTIPQTLEQGGDVQITEQQRRVRGQGLLWHKVNRLKPGLPTRRRTITILARPYMFPALTEAAHRFPELFEDIL